ncbi:MAG: 1-acyl-sn-glycerol-3-phosphate acyltransferase [Cyclobacteriaceae bacterium]|nr:1-acyl-sn-glycerol-3-phosphate acyltransferase [Cyclobacteriaceae bacterium]
MKVVRVIHTGYGLTVFGVLFIIFFPILLIPIISPKRYQLVGIINRWWAHLTFFFNFLSVKVECQTPLDPRKQYIFCPNHFSYLDIPTMGLTPINTIFVGKNDMENIPLFGFMYRKLHITVDRNKLKSKYDTFIKSRLALDQGKSLVIYPEGGIFSKEPPNMVRFKDGAFRLAIEKQIPIVPVTIPNNWILLPDTELLVRPGTVKVIFHTPIETKGMDMSEVDALKHQVFQIIDTQLKNENRQAPAGQDSAPRAS